MTWLSYFNGSLYISVELSGFKGTETRGQLDFSAFLSALGSPGVLARGTLAMFNYDETPMLSKINVPVLLVVGASDIATRPAASIRMKAELPQSDLVILKPAGHMSLMEQNQQFAEAVEKFSVERLELSRSNHLPLQRNMSTTEIARTANSLVSAYENFGFRLLARLAEQDAHKNVFISPFSVAIALAMTYNGARGETEQAIAETLSLTGLSLQEINAASESLLSMGDNLDPQVKLAVANSIWVRQGITLASDFIQRLRDSYDSEATNLNFGNPEAATVINQWVSDKTQEKIKKLVTPDLISDAILILINAVYFKGTWAKQFDKDRTEERDFILLDGSHKLHPMMSQSGCYAYYESEKFQAVSLPYGEGRVSMYIFLPKQSLPIGEFQALLNVENWQYWIAQFDEREGDIVLPRFKVEYKTKLKDTLGALGMGVAFEKNADFGGIGAGDLVISEVIHKTFIDVNEEGTEAAAATAVMMPRMGGFQSRSRFSMVIDRPFFYAIRDSQTGALLFMGFVLDPG
jgi:serpin B